VAIIGYAWTLSDEESQVFDHHIEALTAMGCERVTSDARTVAEQARSSALLVTPDRSSRRRARSEMPGRCLAIAT
jgi:hypothetical protein